MKEFKIIYKILRILQKSMDLEEFDKESLSPERLGISEPKWCRIMAMLIMEGYISGAETWNSMDLNDPPKMEGCSTKWRRRACIYWS